jgi:ribosomal protein S27E
MQEFADLEGYCRVKVTCPGCGLKHKVSADLTSNAIGKTDQLTCACGTVIYWQPAGGFAVVDKKEASA